MYGIFCMAIFVWQFFLYGNFCMVFFVWYFCMGKTLTFLCGNFFVWCFFLCSIPASPYLYTLWFSPFVRHHPTLSPSLDRAGSITLGSCKKIYVTKNRLQHNSFAYGLPTTLLGIALSSLTTVDRTGNGAFC